MSTLNPKKYQVLLVDDHALLRRGIRRLIEKNPRLEVVGEVGDGLEFLQFLETRLPDLAIVDISMPRLGGLEAALQAKARFPGVKILILTMHNSQEYVNQARANGAEGYLLKQTMDLELLPAIETVLGHGSYFSKILAPW